LTKNGGYVADLKKEKIVLNWQLAGDFCRLVTKISFLNMYIDWEVYRKDRGYRLRLQVAGCRKILSFQKLFNEQGKFIVYRY
jgi:hypothetical protein